MNFQKIFLVIFGVMALMTATAGVIMSTNNVTVQKAVDKLFNADNPITYNPLGEFSTDENSLKAMVKGSIYETGEEMTVYGACFRGNGQLEPGANATFDSWYSNGTQWHNNVPMTSIGGTGRWRIQMNMSSISGTYLTQITCSKGGMTAIAFGEWQNPNWVSRLKTINDYVVLINSTTVSIETKVDALEQQINSNVTSIIVEINDLHNATTEYYNNLQEQIANLSFDLSTNFSTVLTEINNLDASSERDTEALYNLIHSLDYSQWIFDVKDYVYTGLPSAYDFTAVDMSSDENVWVVSDGGHIYVFNGTNYTLTTLAGYDWRGVSALEANTNYGWVVGTNGTACYYTINGATPVHLSATSATACEDVVMFYSPTAINGYVVADNGDILLYNGTWTIVNNTGETGDARLEMLPDNSNLFVVQNDTFTVYDGSTWTRYTVSGADFNDVAAVYDDEVYMISDETPFQVYKYDGSTVTSVYTATGSVATGEAISAHNEYDIWVVTDTPGAFYHFDGRQWSFAEYPYSSHIGIVIGFNASAGIDMKDIVMMNEKLGYSVGDDGLIMIFKNHYDNRLDDILNELLSLTCSDSDGNCVELLHNLTNITLAMNASLHADLTDIMNFLVAMNNTIVTEFNTVHTEISNFQSFTNTSFDNVYNLLDNLNATVNYQYANLTLLLTDLNTTIVTNFNDLDDHLTLIDTNLTYIQNQITNLNSNMASNFTFVQNMITAINTSIINEINDNYNLLVQINDTNNFILTNVTYTQLYLENTVFPQINNTYTFLTVNVWNKLLGIETTVNQTLDVVTNINNTANTILNRTPDLRAWITH